MPPGRLEAALAAATRAGHDAVASLLAAIARGSALLTLGERLAGRRRVEKRGARPYSAA